MAPYVLSPQAKKDTDDIWDYSAERWGPDQADHYTSEMRDKIAAVASDYRKGRARNDIRKGYRMYRAGSHMIFFRTVADGIEVIRILHQSMDFRRHLRAEK